MVDTEEVIEAREFEQLLAKAVLICEAVVKVIQENDYDGTETAEDKNLIIAAMRAVNPLRELLKRVVERNNILYGKDDNA